jgi:hypothetical protein
MPDGHLNDLRVVEFLSQTGLCFLIKQSRSEIISVQTADNLTLCKKVGPGEVRGESWTIYRVNRRWQGLRGPRQGRGGWWALADGQACGFAREARAFSDSRAIREKKRFAP